MSIPTKNTILNSTSTKSHRLYAHAEKNIGLIFLQKFGKLINSNKPDII